MSEHIGRETTISAAGKTYKLPRLTRALREELTAWAVEKLKAEPKSLASAKLLKDCLPEDDYKALILSSWRMDQLELNFFHPRVEELTSSQEGLEKGLCILLKAGNPELTDDQCIEILGDATYENDIEYLLDKWRQVEGRTPARILEALKKSREAEYKQIATSNAGSPSIPKSIRITDSDPIR